jgi:hypothetical protein
VHFAAANGLFPLYCQYGLTVRGAHLIPGSTLIVLDDHSKPTDYSPDSSGRGKWPGVGMPFSELMISSEMEEKILEIKALGRPCYLGQLYDAKTSSLLPGFSLFKPSEIQSRENNIHSTKFEFTEVNSHSDRASSLDVSAELSVSILSGSLSVGGSGAYLSNKQDTSESTTVAAIAQYRTTSKSLDLNALRNMVDIEQEMLAKICATHAVTSIAYGGNIVGTLTQKSTNKADNTKIKSNFSIEAFKNMGQWLSGGANTTLTVEERKKINSFNLHIELCADFPLRKNSAPTDPVSMIDVVRNAELFGDGVPCEVSLTPLSMLVDKFSSFRELAKADLIDIVDLYDRILKLENSRAWLRDAVEARSGIFPTFTEDIRGRTIKTTKLVQDARCSLRRYLQDYRSELMDIESPPQFVKGVEARFKTAMAEYDRDKDEWRRYQDRLAAAEQHGFPILGVTAVGSKMSRVDKGTLAAILVPENANWKALMDLYGDLALDIRQWRTSIDKPQGKDEGTVKVPETIYVSIYADPLHDTTLESLDDEAGTLKNALASARYVRALNWSLVPDVPSGDPNVQSSSPTAVRAAISVVRSGTCSTRRAGASSSIKKKTGDTLETFTSPSLMAVVS